MAAIPDEATVARDANRRIRRSGNLAGWAFAGPSVFIVLGLSFIQMFWAGYPGMAFLPSTVAPAGFTMEGLPIGVQIVGPQYGDLATIAAARFLEREHQAFVAPEEFA